MPELIFTEDGHIYKLGGMVIPSVTTILKAQGFISEWGTPEAMDRGTLVHKLTYRIDCSDQTAYGEAEEEGVVGWVDAWENFKRDHDFAMTEGETPRYHSGVVYAMTPDRIGFMAGHEKQVLIDLKSGPKDPAIIYQMVAYHKGLVADGLDLEKVCYSVHLKEDGTYSLVPYKPSRHDWAMFIGLLSAYNWRAQNGRL